MIMIMIMMMMMMMMMMILILVSAQHALMLTYLLVHSETRGLPYDSVVQHASAAKITTLLHLDD